MKRLFLIGLAASAFALAPALSASAMSVTPSTVIGISQDPIVQVRGGHGGGHGRGHMGRGGRGHHYGWSRGRHRGRR